MIVLAGLAIGLVLALSLVGQVGAYRHEANPGSVSIARTSAVRVDLPTHAGVVEQRGDGRHRCGENAGTVGLAGRPVSSVTDVPALWGAARRSGARMAQTG
jgi:hypothetical protein